MRLTVLAVGRMKSGSERDLLDRYTLRLRALGPTVGLTAVEWREFDESRSHASGERRAAEGRVLAEAIPRGAWLAALDERGAALTTAQWAAEIVKARDAGAPSYVVAIGGPDGHDPALRDAARSRIAFGAMTWPHQLIRVMLAEQLYRVATILAGHPYHRA